MSGGTPTPDPIECTKFLRLWMEVTNAPHLTLVAIKPDTNIIIAKSFSSGDLDTAGSWITAQQRATRNIYFQPNETRPGSTRKPSKQEMVAALCRFADIDPELEHFPLAEERERLARLAAHLISDPKFPPTAVIDSGGGIQPLWAITREPLSPSAITRIEGETKAIEDILGAGGTHNVDRLLRLPGTANFPNAKKRKLGRGISHARLIHAGASIYSPGEAAGLTAHLSAHLKGTGHIRPRPRKTDGKPDREADDKDIADLIRQLRAAGADRVSRFGHLPVPLRTRMEAALKSRNRLADGWAGKSGDLTEGNRDSSRSGIDFSLAAMVKAEGFSNLETGLILCAYPHGKANGDDWPDEYSRLRHVARCALRAQEPDPVVALVNEFNERYAVVNEAGKAIIYEAMHDTLLKRNLYQRLMFEDFRRLYLNRLIQVGQGEDGKPVTRPAAELWLHHPDRRQFIGGVVFDPSRRLIRQDVLNLWRGYAVRSRPGTWSRLRDHILRVICGGRQDYFDYLMGWMATLIQHPARQGEVAVGMRGGEGTGKGTLARVLLRILGRHGLAISNSKHLTGNFNGHLRDVVFLFADEAFYAGDKAHIGVLKSLITEPYLTVEAKFQNAIQVPNFVHLMLASNEDWVLPASLDARRFFMLELSNARANDHAYFAAIWGEMDNGGYEAMLHDLLEYDLTFFNVRHVPITEGLRQQRKLSLGTSEAWWADVLHRGYVYRSKLGLEEYFGEWLVEVSTELLFASYEAFAMGRRERHPMSRETFGRFLRDVGGGKAKRLVDAVIGERIADVQNPNGGTTRQAALTKRPRPPGYVVGTLMNARRAFETRTGLAGDWPDDETGAAEAPRS